MEEEEGRGGGASSNLDKQDTLPSSSTYSISFQLSKVFRDPQFLTTFESKAISYNLFKKIHAYL